jgi:hypothetical protein
MSQYCYRDIVVAWKGLRTYGVSQLACTLERIAQAIHSSMKKAKSETRVPKARRAQMAQAWEFGYGDAGWGLKPCGLLTLARQWWLQADCSRLCNLNWPTAIDPFLSLAPLLPMSAAQRLLSIKGVAPMTASGLSSQSQMTASKGGHLSGGCP